MGIVRVDPENWESANVVQVDSDARDNRQALLEVEAWAAEHGFVRTDEYWLRQIIRNDHWHFRGICYRLNEDERAAQKAHARRIDENLSRMPVTVSDPDA